MKSAFLPVSPTAGGFTVIEVMFAIFIFSIVSTSVFKVIQNTDRLKNRAIFVESATRIAGNESERLRNNAALHSELEDSIYTVKLSQRIFSINRKIITSDDNTPSYIPQARVPDLIEITVSDFNDPERHSLKFTFMQGYDNP